ncbi:MULTISPECIES: helix-turn-helix domain-containing protein [unclassified Providencia]|uniref:helix-turn-helix domain-containing protein n=1 Tax=unclassified Providencia TaxID=2633465 RepID=UPI00234AD29A|nr:MULTISPECIES: helix-turn-helix transcriptional regulator [unclassified Providencia]
MEGNKASVFSQVSSRQYLTQAIGRQLCLIRKARGLRGDDIAKKLGVSQQQVSRYERGVCKMDVDALVYLLNQLNEPLDQFFYDVSLILKNEVPKVYAEYQLLFFPLINYSNESCFLTKTESYS